MSINKHKILETEYFKQYMRDGLKESWQKYLDTIDKEIDFIKEWEKVLRIKTKANMELTIEKIQECKKIKEILNEVCPRYFEAHTYDWEIYSDWKFSDEHPEHIVISYAYFDCRGEYEAGEQVVPIETLIKFSKKLQ